VFQAWPTRPLSLSRLFSPLIHRSTPLRRARSELRLRATAAPRVPSAVLLDWTPSSPSFLSFPGCPSIFPFSSMQRSAELARLSPHPSLLRRYRPPGPPLFRSAWPLARPIPLSFPRMGLRQPPSSLLAATPCLATSPVSCPRAASSFSRNVDARVPQPRPQPSRPRLVRHLIPSVPEPVVPVELQVSGITQRRASAQSRSAPGVVRSTGDGPLRLPIWSASPFATTSTPGSSSPTYSMVFPAPRSVYRR
jgi:hypothetical protein